MAKNKAAEIWAEHEALQQEALEKLRKATVTVTEEYVSDRSRFTADTSKVVANGIYLYHHGMDGDAPVTPNGARRILASREASRKMAAKYGPDWRAG